MEVLFKNETIYNKKAYNKFINEHRSKFGCKENLYTILFIFMFVFLLLYLLINKIFITSILLLIAFIVFLEYRFVQPVKNVNKDMESKKIKEQYKNIYKFYKYYFVIKNKEMDEKMFYFRIYRVLESDTYFYIYLSPRQAFIVSKSGFMKGDSSAFSKFIKRKALFKYKTNK